MLPETPCIPYLIGCRDGAVVRPFRGVYSFGAYPRSRTSFGRRIGSLSGNDIIIPHTERGARGLYGSGLSSSGLSLGSDLSYRGGTGLYGSGLSSSGLSLGSDLSYRSVQMPMTGAVEHFFMKPDKPDFVLLQKGDASLGPSWAAVFWFSCVSILVLVLLKRSIVPLGTGLR